MLLLSFALVAAKEWRNSGVSFKYDPVEFPPPNLDVTLKNECAEPVEFYHADLGFDALVAEVDAGATAHVKGNLGQQWFAVTKAPAYLAASGDFWVHWNESMPPVVGAGESRVLVATCAAATAAATADDAAACDGGAGDDEDDSCASSRPRSRPPRLDPNKVPNADVWHSRRWNEWTRYRMASEQPAVVKKYTEKGFFASYRMEDVAPRSWKLIKAHYEAHKDTKAEVVESWQQDNTYVNHWEVPTTVVHLPHQTKAVVWEELAPLFGRWAGVDPKSLEGTSIYGVRRYWRGSYLRNHVDRGDVLVISAIVHVDSKNLSEPWPLQIYDHSSSPQPHHVIMNPGDIVLYESAAAIHGRPLPLKGDYYANVFCHTKPKDWTYKGWSAADGEREPVH